MALGNRWLIVCSENESILGETSGSCVWVVGEDGWTKPRRHVLAEGQQLVGVAAGKGFCDVFETLLVTFLKRC
jgi:hypothetical protein